MPMITDWLMVGITGIYVIATIFICIFNGKSAKATREQVAESHRQFEETKRLQVMPFLQISVHDSMVNANEDLLSSTMLVVLNRNEPNEYKKCDYTICIKNIGLGIAHHISCDYYSSNQSTNDKKDDVAIGVNGLFSKNAQFVIHENCNQSHGVRFSTTVRYCDILGNRYHQKVNMVFILDALATVEENKFRLLHAELSAPVADAEGE